MDGEQQDPREADGPRSDDSVDDPSSALEGEDVDEDAPTSESAEVRDPARRIVDSALPRPMFIPPDLFRGLREQQANLAKSVTSNLLASSALRDAWRPIIPPDLFQCGSSRSSWRRLSESSPRPSGAASCGRAPNWQFEDDWPKCIRISETVEQDGIPLAWVPRSDIVAGLVDAEGIEARRTILADREDDNSLDQIQEARVALEEGQILGRAIIEL